MNSRFFLLIETIDFNRIRTISLFGVKSNQQEKSILTSLTFQFIYSSRLWYFCKVHGIGQKKIFLKHIFALKSGQDKGVLMNMQNAFWQDNEEDNV